MSSPKFARLQPLQELVALAPTGSLGQEPSAPAKASAAVGSSLPVWWVGLQPKPPRALPSQNDGVGADQKTSAETIANSSIEEFRPVMPRIEYRPTTYFDVRQQWEGVVQALFADSFVATLKDKTDRTKMDERATFQMDEIANGDKELIAVGAVFYWSLGYESSITGEKRAVSAVRFRRLPAWSRSELAEIAREADELEHVFASEPRDTTGTR